MKNKELEIIIKNTGCSEIIPIIEMCEMDKRIRAIEVNKKTGLTRSSFVNECIKLYLKELKISIKYIDMDEKVPELLTYEKKPTKNKCNNSVHTPFKRNLSREKKIEMYNNFKMKMFSIENNSWVICPECGLFEKI